jgi:hypothetical protein
MIYDYARVATNTQDRNQVAQLKAVESRVAIAERLARADRVAFSVPGKDDGLTGGSELSSPRREGIGIMGITLNHTIIVARNKEETATFLTEILGLPPGYDPV